MLLFFSCWTISSQVSNGSSPIPNHSISSEETLSPPQKTSSSANGACGSLVLKRSQSSSGKPWKVPRSSVDHLSNAKKASAFQRPDPTSPLHNYNPEACPQANSSEKSVSNGQPSPVPGLQLQLQYNQLSQATIESDSSPTDSDVSVPPPNCDGMSRFQCEHCKTNFWGKKWLYKHKKNTSRPTVLTTMQEKIQEVNILVVQSAKKNKQHEMNLLIPSFGTNIITNPDKMTKSHYRLQRDLKCKNKS